MKSRIEVGTDVAMLGVWDAGRSVLPLDEKGFAGIAEMLEQDSADGHLFLIHTGADGGGPVDVFVDEPAPADLVERCKSLTERDYLVAVPTGRLVLGGAEDYRSRKPINTSERSIVAIPPGDYRLRCYAGPDESEETPASEKEIYSAVGEENVRYHDRMTNLGCGLSALTLLVFPAVAIPFNWKLALPATIVAFIGYFWLLAWVLRRIPRYRDLDKIITTMRLESRDPDFVFVLTRTEIREGLTGGSVNLV